MSDQVRSLSLIAQEIKRDWKDPYFGAKPYIEAMLTIKTIKDSYGCESAESVVNYFLANSAQWRGEVARRIKKELRDLLKRA